MYKSIKDIDFKTVDMYDIIHMDKEFFEGMSNEQAADILEKQLKRYNKGGLYSPRPHLGKALELAVKSLRKSK